MPGGFNADFNEDFGPLAAVVPPIPPLTAAAGIIITVRDPQSLALLGQVNEYNSLSWKRRDRDMGEFRIVIPRALLSDELAENTLLWEVYRNGLPEFASIARGRILPDAGFNTSSEAWEITGGDLKWILEGRIIDVDGSAFDEQSGVPAETAMKHYVEDHLSTGAGASRDFDSELLSGITFDVLVDNGRGADVDFNGRWNKLLTGVLVPLARLGGIYHSVELRRASAASAPTGYDYDVHEYRDRTSQVVISPLRSDLSSLIYKENMTGLVNAVYALGDGTGAARSVELVTNISATTGVFRREATIDARDADDAGKQTDAAQEAIDRSVLEAITVEAGPLTIGPQQYRTDWDLGDDVTITIPDIVSITRRIVEVGITVTEIEGEQITIQLGSRPGSEARILAETQRRARPSQTE